MISRFLARNEKLPRLAKYEERLRRLVDWEFLFSPGHREKLWSVDREKMNASAREFVARFITVAGAHGIPVYCRDAHEERVEMVHAQFEDRLEDDDWVILGQIGDEVIEGCFEKASWAGWAGGDPAIWDCSSR